jgi:dipeptidyl aminopeptidase/acylaminoacyl peptidase
MAPSKLAAFDRVDFDYKTVHGHPIKTSVLIPKGLQSKPREAYPTIVNWHGGGFVVGDRLYEGWLPQWYV